MEQSGLHRRAEHGMVNDQKIVLPAKRLEAHVPKLVQAAFFPPDGDAGVQFLIPLPRRHQGR